MDIKDIKELIELVNSSELSLFELKQGDLSIKMDKSLTRSSADRNEEVKNLSIIKETTEVVATSEEKVTNKVVNEAVLEEDLYVITSPMVGTFYGASAPGAPAFVSEGSSIKKGNTVCIIEAMKLMNEIESEVNGEVVKVLVEDGDMVEYGQPIFKIRRA